MVFIKIRLHGTHPEERVQYRSTWPPSTNVNCIDLLGGLWRERGKMRRLLVRDIRSPLNNTLVTQSDDCLFTFAPTPLQGRIVARNGKLWGGAADLKCAWPNSLLWWPKAKWQEQAESSQVCSAGLSSTSTLTHPEQGCPWWYRHVYLCWKNKMLHSKCSLELETTFLTHTLPLTKYGPDSLTEK